MTYLILVKYSQKSSGVGYEVDVNNRLTMGNNEGNSFVQFWGWKPPSKCLFLVTLFEGRCRLWFQLNNKDKSETGPIMHDFWYRVWEFETLQLQTLQTIAPRKRQYVPISSVITLNYRQIALVLDGYWKG